MGRFERKSLTRWVDTFRAPNVVTVDDQRAAGIVHDPRNGFALTKREVADLLSKLGTFTAADMHRTQPNIRTAVDFLARNVAQVGVHTYARDGEDGRKRDRTSDAAKVLGEPSPVQTEYELVYSIVADLALFDECWLWLTRVPTSVHHTGWILRPLPVRGVSIVSGSEWLGTLKIEVSLDGGDPIPLDGSDVIHLRGWNPAYGSEGVPAIESLKGVLAEQIAAQAYRLGVWKNGGQAASYIYRPKDAPEWGPKAKARFVEGFRAFMAGGANRGGMPILEDGMEIRTNRLTAKEEQFVEAAALSLETVCRVYHINPAMLGATGGVTYANMREFRKGLYGETLGPILAQVQQKMTARLLPMLGAPAGTYAEFNLKAKLAGDFEQEAAVLQQAVGGPYMKLNEARARQNLPAVEGGDEILVPLNMTRASEQDDPEGGDEPPADGPAGAGAGEDTPKAFGTLSGAPGVVQRKAAPREGERTVDLLRGVVSKHAERQRAAVMSKLGSKSASWWDGERWDKELTEDLFRVAGMVTAQIGTQVATDLGFSGAYDVGPTVSFLHAVAKSRASMLNETTRIALEDALAKGTDPANVFDQLDGARGEQAAGTLHTTLAAFAGVEAAKHVARKSTPADEPPARATKTWVVTSGSKARKAHSKLNGQTVGIDEKFSNGADWPGDPVLGADGVAGCMCSVEVSVEVP